MLDLISPLPLWVVAPASAALIYTAIIDARTGLVPPMPLALATVLAFIAQVLLNTPQASGIIALALAFYLGIWVLNEVYYTLAKQDALGMGDAAWSGLAILVFGLPAVLWAWGGAAWLALIHLAYKKLRRQDATQVYFLPYLAAALVIVLGVKLKILS